MKIPGVSALSYAAAALDLRGRIRTSTPDDYATPIIEIASSYAVLPDWLAYTFDIGTSRVSIRATKDRNALHVWTVRGQDAIDFVSAIEEYLKFKATYVHVLKRWHPRQRGHTPMDERTRQRRIEFAQAIRALNRLHP